MSEIENTVEVAKLMSLFFPYAIERLQEAREQKTKLAHYTSAEAAVKILRSNEIWLRNARIMNDFSEIEHGNQCLLSAWHSAESGAKLKFLLDDIERGLAAKIGNLLDEGDQERKFETYIFSLSEHDDSDGYGRLSMWRAYGGASNVAMIFKGLEEDRNWKPKMISLSPVLYADKESFYKQFTNFVSGLEKETEFLKRVSNANQELIPAIILSAFTHAINCTKHPSFSEEREWRLLYSKQIDVFGLDDRASDLIVKKSIEIIDGIPQNIAKLQLVDVPAIDFVDNTLPNLLERIILGPNANPWILFDGIYSEMTAASVDIRKVPLKISNIPLRR